MSATDERKYLMTVRWSEQDERFIADFPDLKNCSAHGRTAAEAAREAVRARRVWLRARAKAGLEPPDLTLSNAIASIGVVQPSASELRDIEPCTPHPHQGTTGGNVGKTPLREQPNT